VVGLVIALAGCAAPAPVLDPVIVDPPEDLSHPPRLWEGAFESEGEAMNAIAYVPAGPGPHPVAILLHGFPGNERNLDLAHTLRRGGWNVVFFHYRGAWGSAGVFSFGNALEDVGAVIARVREPQWAADHRADPERIVLVGHSMGGFMAIAGATESPAVRCVVALAPADLSRAAPDDLLGPVAREAARRLDAMAAGRLAGTSGMALVTELYAERDRFDPMQRVAGLGDRPVLVVAGSRDRVVPLYGQKRFVDAVNENGGRARLVVLDADHAFSSQRITLARQVLGFLDGRCR